MEGEARLFGSGSRVSTYILNSALNLISFTFSNHSAMELLRGDMHLSK